MVIKVALHKPVSSRAMRIRSRRPVEPFIQACAIAGSATTLNSGEGGSFGGGVGEFSPSWFTVFVDTHEVPPIREVRKLDALS